MAATTLSGSSKNVAEFRGCLQGVVLPPILWCLVVHDLIARLNEGGIYTQTYVDDICFL
jgi:hypothetical protein